MSLDDVTQDFGYVKKKSKNSNTIIYESMQELKQEPFCTEHADKILAPPTQEIALHNLNILLMLRKEM